MIEAIPVVRAEAAARKLRVVAADDEPLALKGIVDLLSADPDVEVVARCTDGESAVAAILRESPDVVFLDVQMPGMDGFDVVERVGVANMPVVVFVTAFERYALDAFEAEAMDYLLKPFSNERFFAALSRARKTVNQRQLAETNKSLAAVIANAVASRSTNDSPRQQRIGVKVGNRMYFIPITDIDWIEGADYCSNVHASGRGHMIRESLTSLADRLDNNIFLRVHRSAILNVTRVKEIQAPFAGEAVALLHTGERVKIARGKRKELESLLEGRRRPADT